MPPKGSGTRSPWVVCDSCQIYVTNEQIEQHTSNCPPDFTKVAHPFIYEKKLYGIVDCKSNEDINGVSSSQKEKMVFLSQSVFQLCSIAIDDWVVIENLQDPKSIPFARIAWPTREKSLFSVLFPKRGLDNSFVNKSVKVEKIDEDLDEATQVVIVPLPSQYSFKFTSELQLRLRKSNSNSLFCEGNIVQILFYGTFLKFQIKSIISEKGTLEKAFDEMSLKPYKFFKATEKTSWKIYKNEEGIQENTPSTNLLEELGGLSEEISEIECLMQTALRKGTKYKVSRAIILFGCSGTGKSTLAKGLARKSGAHIVSINSAQLYEKSDGKIVDLLKDLFKEAFDRAPCVILMDDVDDLCPIKSSRLSDTDRRTASSVLMFLDDLHSKKDCQVFVIATTNKRDALDPVFRRCGRFDEEIEIPIPNPQGRYEILLKLNQPDNEISGEDLKELGNKTHGYVGADLVSLCNKARINASKNGRITINTEDLSVAMQIVQPSAMRAVKIESPNVKWTDIGGQKDLKLILQQAVEWPIKYPEKFTKMGITPPRGVLMYGPPGCSKTMIAKALATESGLNFLSVKGPEIFSKWVGESERAIRVIFQLARQVAPSIVFFDEIDAIGGERSSESTASVQERVVAQLLTELDGVTPLRNVIILAATNRPDKMDKALLRPGRLDRIVYVPLPNDETRREIFKIKFGKIPVKNVDVEELVRLTEGYSGAEVNAVCNQAAMMALEEDFDSESVEMRHFLKALNLITPRTPPSLINIYENYIKNI